VAERGIATVPDSEPPGWLGCADEL